MNLSQEKYNLIIGASIAKCSHQESNVSLVVQSESIVPNRNPTSVDDSEPSFVFLVSFNSTVLWYC